VDEPAGCPLARRQRHADAEADNEPRVSHELCPCPSLLKFYLHDRKIVETLDFPSVCVSTRNNVEN